MKPNIAATAALCPAAFAAAGAAAPRTRACAHRGDQETAPENTLPAVLAAVRKGAPQIEFDVKLTRDGRMVILHDNTVDRTTSGKGKVAELTSEELRRLDAGIWFAPRFAGTRIPTLRELLDAIPPAVRCNVHLAAVPDLAVPAARMLRDTGHLKRSFLACTVEQAREARAAVPGIRICIMEGRTGPLAEYIRTAIAARADFVQVRDTGGGIPENLAAAVRELHAHGVTVNYFGAQDEPKIRALAAAGVDYILTDRLDLCQRVLAGRP